MERKSKRARKKGSDGNKHPFRDMKRERFFFVHSLRERRRGRGRERGRNSVFERKEAIKEGSNKALARKEDSE